MASDQRLSRSLAKFLRHDAKSRGIALTREGYANVDDILRLHDFRKYDEEDIEAVVENDRKGRFATRYSDGILQVKATQGHTIGLSAPELKLIGHPSEARMVLHGTTLGNMNNIKKMGISRMKRDHIHFVRTESSDQSGIPSKCDIAIEINIEKAMRDGIKFYEAENGVILSPGDTNGFIPTKYFRRVYHLKTRNSIPF